MLKEKNIFYNLWDGKYVPQVTEEMCNHTKNKVRFLSWISECHEEMGTI